MERLLPDPGQTTVAEQIADFDPIGLAGEERPYVYVNFAATVDGRATLEGRSGEIGSDTDTAVLVALRARAEAVMVGAGTIRAERYGRLIPDPRKREARERRGLAGDPLAVIVSGRLDLPWDAPIFTCGEGSVLILTGSDSAPPETATPVEVERHPGGVDLAGAMGRMRRERAIRALLCEGGPGLHGELQARGLVDEVFLTRGPLISGGEGPGIVARLDERRIDLELAWLLREGSELFARYRVRR